MNGISRRQFLKSTAAAAGAAVSPYYVPASALGKTGRAAPAERITIGCIGVGGQGTGNMKAFLQQPDTQVVAVCDVDAHHKQKAAYAVNEVYGNAGCAEYADFRQLLSRSDIDAVVICTPDHWHGPTAAAAARAGKDIYCEKPLANTIPGGRAIADEAKRYGRVVQTGSHERSNDSARFGCELVRNGRLGKIHTVRINLPARIPQRPARPPEPVPEWFDYDFWLGPAPWAAYNKDRCHGHWRWNLEYGGGEITDRGAHVMDLAQLGLDTDNTGPVEVWAHGSRPPDGMYNCFIDFQYECRYKNGVRMIGQSAGERGVEFLGTDGRLFIKIHGSQLTADPPELLRETIGPGEIHLGRSRGHRRNFLDAVKNRGETVAPAEAGHRTASLCHLVNISMLTEEKLRWDPAAERVTNSPRADALVRRPMRSPWRL